MESREARDVIMRMYKGDPTDIQKEALDLVYKILDIGLSPEQIIELKERDTEYFCKTSIFDYESGVCKCGNDIEKDSGFNFCPYCGNRIKLED